MREVCVAAVEYIIPRTSALSLFGAKGFSRRGFCTCSKNLRARLVKAPPVVSAEIALPPVARSRPPTMNIVLTAFVKLSALAVKILFVPQESISRFVNVTLPLPAAVPMSRFVVPISGPLPVDKEIVNVLCVANPTAEKLPN